MQIFVYVVGHGSFRSASSHFELSATMVGKHIQYLESCLGTKLLNRTTRKQSLTESGSHYYYECQRILEDIANAENQIQAIENNPKGTVSVNSPVTFGNKILAPVIVEFLARYPSINIDLTLDNNLIDPMHEQYDVVIRIGELADSSLIARQIGTYELIYCASPRYLEQHNPICTLQDLKQHTCLGFSYSDAIVHSSQHSFTRGNTRLKSNNGEVLKHASLNHLGVILQPKILLDKELEEGSLKPILMEYAPTPSAIHLLYKDKSLSLKNRTFVEFALSALRY